MRVIITICSLLIFGILSAGDIDQKGMQKDVFTYLDIEKQPDTDIYYILKGRLQFVAGNKITFKPVYRKRLMSGWMGKEILQDLETHSGILTFNISRIFLPFESSDYVFILFQKNDKGYEPAAVMPKNFARFTR